MRSLTLALALIASGCAGLKRTPGEIAAERANAPDSQRAVSDQRWFRAELSRCEEIQGAQQDTCLGELMVSGTARLMVDYPMASAKVAQVYFDSAKYEWMRARQKELYGVELPGPLDFNTAGDKVRAIVDLYEESFNRAHKSRKSDVDAENLANALALAGQSMGRAAASIEQGQRNVELSRIRSSLDTISLKMR